MNHHNHMTDLLVDMSEQMGTTRKETIQEIMADARQHYRLHEMSGFIAAAARLGQLKLDGVHVPKTMLGEISNMADGLHKPLPAPKPINRALFNARNDKRLTRAQRRMMGSKRKRPMAALIDTFKTPDGVVVAYLHATKGWKREPIRPTTATPLWTEIEQKPTPPRYALTTPGYIGALNARKVGRAVAA